MQLATSKNLTYLGILTIIGAVINAALDYFSGRPIDMKVTLTAVSGGLAMIMAKGQANTGGTVPSTPEAEKRIQQAGFIQLRMASALVAGCVLFLAGCSVLSKTTGSTGDLDLGKGVVCSVTLSPVDQSACTKAISQSCEIPLPQDAAGGCKLDAIVASVPFEPGRGWTCSVTAVAGAKACSKRLVTSCVAPAARGSDGACL